MSCKSLKKPKLSEIGNEMISMNRQVFSVHKILLQKTTKFFDQQLDSESGKKGLIFLNDEDPEIYRWFNDWLYTGNVPMAPYSVTLKKIPASLLERAALEEDLRQRFDNHVRKLVDLYILGETLSIEALQNKTVDTIQDSFNGYGTVLGPGLLEAIFTLTTSNCPLRDLAIATNILHLDRGCRQLHQEVIRVCITCPDFLPHMLRWISRNFAMFGRRFTELDNPIGHGGGFSMLNRTQLCSCHFHKHVKGGAHKEHAKCAIPYEKCGHGDDDEDETKAGVASFSLADLLSLSMAFGGSGSGGTH